MTDEEIAKLNTKRLQIQLDPIYKQLDKDNFNYYKKLKFWDVKAGNREIKLSDIDFNKSMIFISDKDILAYISMYALEKVSGVRFPDLTKSGKYSRIKKDYFLVESNEMRYSSKAGFDIADISEIPDIYKPEYFYIKPLVIWRLGLTLASRFNDYMYDFCCERVWERMYRQYTDWIFFNGTLQQFHNTYKKMPDSIPIYVASTRLNLVNITSSEGKDDLF